MPERSALREPSVRRVGWLAVCATLGMTAIGLLWGVDFGLSVAAGGLLALLHFSALRWMIERVAQPSPSRGTKLALLGFGLRYALLGAALYVIFAVWKANVVAVSLGLSAPVAAIFFEWGFEAFEGRARS
jgi:uncharacterized membrane protein (UPF0136 family)